MIKHILLAANGSRTSLAAEDYALHLADTLKTRLTVVYIKDDHLAHYGEVDQLMSEVAKEQFAAYVKNNNDTATRRIADNFGQKADRRGVNYTLVVKSGAPEEKIVALAAEKAADLLVIGSGSRSVRRFARSSGIAGKIIKNSPCPVFTAV